MLPHSVGEGVPLTRHRGLSSVYEDALQGVLYDGLKNASYKTVTQQAYLPFKDEVQTALFKDPVRTAL
jgi:hypothetical protein